MNNIRTFGEINSMHVLVPNNNSKNTYDDNGIDFFNDLNSSNSKALRLSYEENADSEAIRKKLDTLLNSKKIIGIDIETTGAMNGNDSSSFGITEIAVNLIEPKSTIVNKTIVDLHMGIDQATNAVQKNLVLKYFNDNSLLTDAERDSVEVMINRMNFNLGTENKEISQENMLASIDNITKKFNKNANHAYNSAEFDIPALLLRDNIVKAIKEGTPLFGHNFKKAEVPWLNQFFKMHNLDPVDFSKANIIDTFEIVQGIKGQLLDIYNEAGEESAERTMTLESLKKLTKTESTSHIAANDITDNYNIFVTPMEDGETLGNKILDILKTRKPHKTKLDKNSLLFSTKATPKGSAFDMVYDYKGGKQGYRNYVSSRGLFYKFKNLRYIENVPESIGKEFKDGAYVLQLETVDNDNMKYTTSIVRSNLDDITDIINSNFDVYKIVPDDKSNITNKEISVVDAIIQNRVQHKDNARRFMASLFEGNIDSEYKAKKMYEAYEDINNSLGKDVTQEQVQELVYNGELKINGETFKRDDVLGDKLKSLEQMRNFVNNYQTLKDSHDTIKLIIDEIEDKINFNNAEYPHKKEQTERFIQEINNKDKELGLTRTPEEVKAVAEEMSKEEGKKILNQKKSTALSKTMKRLGIIVDENSNAGISLNSEISQNVLYTNYATINIGDERMGIDISTEEKAMRGINRAIYSDRDSSLTEANIKLSRLNKAKKIAEDLNQRGIIDYKTFKMVSIAKDPFAAANLLGSKLYESKQEELNNATDFWEYYLSNKFNQNDSTVYTGGMKVNDETLDEYMQVLPDIIANNQGLSKSNVSANTMVKQLVNDAIEEENSKFNIALSTTGKESSEQIRRRLAETLKPLGYDNYDINEISRVISGNESSYINRGYNIKFINQTNDKGEITTSILAYKPENTQSVEKALAMNEIPTNALIQALPNRVNHLDGNIQTIKMGKSEKLNVKKINSFIVTGDDGQREIVYNTTTTSAQSIRGGIILHKSIDELVDNGEYEKANNKIKKRTLESLSEAPGASAYGTRIFEDGSMSKEYIPAMSDELGMIDLDAIIPNIDQLFDEKSPYYNEEIRKNAEQLIGKDAINKVHNKIQRIVKFGNGSEPPTLKDVGSASPKYKEYITRNLIRGDNLLNKVANNGSLPENISKFLNEIEAQGAVQIMSVNEYKKLAVTTLDARKFMPYTSNNTSRRPQTIQNLHTVAMFKSELDIRSKELGYTKDFHERFREKQDHGLGIEVGDFVRTNYANARYFEPLSKEGGILSFHGTVKQITTSELEEALKNIDKQKILKKYNSRHEDKITIADIDNMIFQYAASGGTDEQHSFIRPSIAKELEFKHDLQKFNIGKEQIENMNVNDIINKNTVIRTINRNGNIREINYTGPAGKIVDIDKERGSIYVKPDVASVNATKYAVGYSEKTVASHIFEVNGKDRTELGDLIFDELGGKSSIMLSNFEYLKHESGAPMIGSKIDSALEILKYNNNDKTQQVFIDLLNSNMKGYNFKKVERHGETIFTMDNPEIAVNDIKNITNFMKDIKRLTKDGETEDIRRTAKRISSTWKWLDKNNSLYLSASRMPMIETMSSDAENQKGMKTTPKTRNVMGETFDNEFYSVDENGNIRKTMTPIIEHQLEQIKNGSNRIAVQDYENILNANRLEAGIEVPGAKVAEINLDNVYIPQTKDLTIEDISEHFFNKFKDYNVIKVNLGNQYVINPYTFEKEKTKALEVLESQIDKNLYTEAEFERIRKTLERKAEGIAKPKAMTNSIFIGITHPLVVNDDEVYYSESMKGVTSLINKLQRSQQKDALRHFGSKNKMDKEINEAVKKYYEALFADTNNKEGLLQGHVLSGRLPFSSNTLNVGIVKMNFTNKEMTEIDNPLGKNFIKIGKDGKPIYESIEYISNDMVHNILGIKSETIGKQIIDEKYDYDLIKQSLIDKGLINEKGERITTSLEEYIKKFGSDEGYNELVQKEIAKINTETGNIYLHEVGLAGTSTRPPEFMPGSTVAVRFRVLDHLHGKERILTEANAQFQNADIDSDKHQIYALLEKDKNGEIKMIDSNSNIMRGYYETLEARQQMNTKWIIERDKLPNHRDDITLTAMEENIKKVEEGNEYFKKYTNYNLDNSIYEVSVKAGVNKGDIGFVSVQNSKIQNMLLKSEAMKLANNNISFKNLKDARSILTLSEQKIIDVKHLTEGDYSIAEVYSISVNGMASAKNQTELNDAFKTYVAAIKNSPMYKDSSFINAQDIIDNNYDKNNSDLNGLREIYDLFSNKQTRDIFNDPLSKNYSSNKILSNLEIIESTKINSDTKGGIVQQKNKFLNEVEEKYSKTSIKRKKIIERPNIIMPEIKPQEEIIDFNKYIDTNPLVMQQAIIENEVIKNGVTGRKRINKFINKQGEKHKISNKMLKEIKKSIFADLKSNAHTEDFINYAANLSDEEKAMKIYVGHKVHRLINRKEINKDEAKELLDQINNNIIEKGRKAKINNNQLKTNINKYLKTYTKNMLENNNNIIKEINNIDVFSKLEISQFVYNDTVPYQLEIERINNGIDDINTVQYVADQIKRKRKRVFEFNDSQIEKRNSLFNDAFQSKSGTYEILHWKEYGDKKFDIIKMGNSKVGFGEYANHALKDLSADDLKKILQDDKFLNADPNLVKQSKMRIDFYLKHLNYEDKISSKTIPITKQKQIKDYVDLSDINKDIINKAYEHKAKRLDKEARENSRRFKDASTKAKENMKDSEDFVHAPNGSAKEAAEELGEKMAKEQIKESEELLKDTKKWYKNKYVVGLGLTAAVLGLATAHHNSKKYLIPNSKKDEDDLPYKAPATPYKNRTILNGVNMHISGTTNQNSISSREALYGEVNKIINSSTNSVVTMNTTDTDDKTINKDSWLKRQFASLIK